MKNNNNIMTFNNLDEYNDFIKSKLLLKKLGDNSENVCYLSSQDNLVYKILLYSLYEARSNSYKLPEIITTKDIKLESFAFPQELHAILQKLVSYSAEYIPLDLFNYHDLVTKPESIYKIDFDSLKNAYDKMLKDIEKLSQENIKIVNLPCNLIFTGKRLVGIDTCFYRRENIKSLEQNIVSLNESIKEVFDTWLLFNLKKEERVEYLSTESQDLLEYLNKVNKVANKVKKRIK